MWTSSVAAPTSPTQAVTLTPQEGTAYDMHGRRKRGESSLAPIIITVPIHVVERLKCAFLVCLCSPRFTQWFGFGPLKILPLTFQVHIMNTSPFTL